jgi:hypothetical protein
VEGRVQALLEAADDTHLEELKPCDMHKLIKSLKLRTAYGIDGISNECNRHLPRRPAVHLTLLLITASSYGIFQSLRKTQKS